jgi:hypothetical protein
LGERLSQPGQLSGILNWALQGWYDFTDNGLKIAIPEDMIELRESLRLQFSPKESFIKEHIILDDDAVSPVVALENAFVTWCKDNLIDLSQYKEYEFSNYIKNEYKLERKKKRVSGYPSPVSCLLGVRVADGEEEQVEGAA